MITEYLFLGPYASAVDLNVLQNLGIRRIINCAAEIRNPFEGHNMAEKHVGWHITYLSVRVLNNSSHYS